MTQDDPTSCWYCLGVQDLFGSVAFFIKDDKITRTNLKKLQQEKEKVCFLNQPYLIQVSCLADTLTSEEKQNKLEG